MANKKSIYFDIFARDNSGKTMRGVGNNAQALGDNLRKVGAAVGLGLAAVGAAAIKMGVDSVQAFAQAEEAQNKLSFAYEKFPALADVSIVAIRRLNSELALKTRYDDDATASAQAVLAQFGLTGDQLLRLTPLLQDYAARTGKDLTGAAEDLGRALLGQGRALKVVGLDLKDAGSVTANFDQLVAGLSATVGGFAERDATTASGKLAILTNRFGEVQEAVGEALMPALDKLLDWVSGDGLRALEGFAAWFADDGIVVIGDFVDVIGQLAGDGTLVPNVVAGIGAITSAQWLMNAAMAANPVGLVIAGITALAALAVVVVANWNEVSKIVFQTTGGIMKGAFALAIGIATGIQNVINAILNGLSRIVGPINALAGLFGLSGIAIPSSVDFVSRLQSTASQLGTMIDAGTLGGLDYLSNGFQPIDRGPSAANPGSMLAMAAGGIVQPTRGGTPAIIGEAGYPEAVIPLTRTALAEYGLGGGGGDTYILQVPQGSFIGNREEFARWATKALEDARKNGVIRRTARA